MKLPGAALLILFGISAVRASAEAADWHSRWYATAYAYPGITELCKDSLLNPDNQIARLPEQSQRAELRFDFKAEHDKLHLSLRPILRWQKNSNAFSDETRHEAYLSQGRLRWSLAEAWNLSAGREVMTWGAGQFRSPSNPFYFDNGRSDPLRELSGLDAMKLSWTPDTRHSLSVGYIVSSGHDDGAIDNWQDTWILRATQRESNWAGGIALAKKAGQQVFVGIDGQYTLNDAVLLYVEVGSSTHLAALQSPVDAAQPFYIDTESARHTNALIGASYTFENGQSLGLEYLHQGHGFTAAEEAAYFNRAASATLPSGANTLSMALAYAPPLLGRDYLYLLWQNNILESDGYWRLMWARSLTDHGSQFSGYAEWTLGRRLSAFVLGIKPLGDARQEFSSLISSMAMAGIKVALP